ncbi:hypothetical protein FQN54_004897 [Arachnomyces sp. PD_36]|nr:hypothetical protein FQN54_004897 [Arachnomyces sp. PD_36]
MDFQSNGTHITLYEHTPSGGAAYTFTALFGLITVSHFIYMIPLRAAYFIPFLIGGICETFGFYGRAWSSRDPKNMKPFVLQSFLILGGPVFLAATIYMSLGRLITSLDGSGHAIIRPRWITKLFLLGDILCFCSQFTGLGLQATGDAGIMKTGRIVVVGGLVFQLLVFGFFVILTWNFHVRLNRDPSKISDNPAFRWKRYIIGIYCTSGCILVRNIFRIFEYAQGHGGFIAKHEAIIYVFDAALMFLVMVVFLVVHPSWLMKAIRRSEKHKSSASEGSMIPLSG